MKNNNKQRFFDLFALLPALLVTLFSGTTQAQNVQVVASGFTEVAGLSLDVAGNLWIPEDGTGHNDGKVSVLSPNGTLYTVITALPSYYDSVAQETSGAWRALRTGNKLEVMVGGGSDPNAGALLTFDLTGYSFGSAPLQVAQASSVLHISDFVLAHGFPESDPYTFTWAANGDGYFVDAAANAVLKRDHSTGSFSVLHVFPPFPNVYTPFPPFIDYVPTVIQPNPAGGYYICNLTGFPFLPGLSSVVKMDENGAVTPYADNLSVSVDMQVDPATGDLYVLQLGVFDSTFAPVFNSALITKIKPNGERSIYASGFGFSSAMLLDGTGGVYVSDLFTGQIKHITFPLSAHEPKPGIVTGLQAGPNPAIEITDLRFQLAEAAAVQYAVFNSAGKAVRHIAMGEMPAGGQDIPLRLENLPSGFYFVTVWTEKGNQTIRIVRE